MFDRYVDDEHFHRKLSFVSLNLQPRGENGRLNNVHWGEIDVLPADFLIFFTFMADFMARVWNMAETLKKKINMTSCPTMTVFLMETFLDCVKLINDFILHFFSFHRLFFSTFSFSGYQHWKSRELTTAPRGLAIKRFLMGPQTPPYWTAAGNGRLLQAISQEAEQGLPLPVANQDCGFSVHLQDKSHR